MIIFLLLFDPWRGRSHEASWKRDRMRRPSHASQACLGRLRVAVRVLERPRRHGRLMERDEGGPKSAGSCGPSRPQSFSSQNGPQGEKSPPMERREASAQSQARAALRMRGLLWRLSALHSPRFSRGERDDGAPGAAKNTGADARPRASFDALWRALFYARAFVWAANARSAGCLKHESEG
jgi:hypothetical protein